jgi:hypothetical protein
VLRSIPELELAGYIWIIEIMIMIIIVEKITASEVGCLPASASQEAIILPVGDHLAQFTAASCFMVQSHLGRRKVFWEGFGKGTAQSFTQPSWPAVTSFQTDTTSSVSGDAKAKSTSNLL